MSEKIDEIWTHPLYRTELEQIKAFEKDRPFCRHTPEHFLDVARLMYIEVLERGLPFEKNLIYAAALLHDIGRAAQYRDGTPHDRAGAGLASIILKDLGWSREEITMICTAIAGHRDKSSLTETSGLISGSASDRVDRTSLLADLLKRADKASRLCFQCPAVRECNWPDRRKKQLPEV